MAGWWRSPSTPCGFMAPPIVELPPIFISDTGKVSPACDRCYAVAQEDVGMSAYGGWPTSAYQCCSPPRSASLES